MIDNNYPSYGCLHCGGEIQIVDNGRFNETESLDIMEDHTKECTESNPLNDSSLFYQE